MANYLTEAFKQLNSLKEEMFPLDSCGRKKLKDFIEGDLVEEESIIDPEALKVDDLKETYDGEVVLHCCVCNSLIYKQPEEIIIDEETNMANVGELCPYCGSDKGFTVAGEIKPGKETKKEAEESQLTESIGADTIFEGLKGIFRGYSPDEARELFSTWSYRLNKPTDPDEVKEYEEYKMLYGEEVTITGCSILNEGENLAETFDKSYWEVEFRDGTSMSGVSGYNIDLYSIPTKRRSVREKLEDKISSSEDKETKKEIEPKRRAMFASGYKGECLKESWAEELPSTLGTSLRTAIDLGDIEETISSLKDIIEYLRDQFEGDSDFESLSDDIEVLDSDSDEDDVDFVLNELYDFCDENRIWIPLSESVQKRSRRRPIKESFERVEVETEDQTMRMSQDSATGKTIIETEPKRKASATKSTIEPLDAKTKSTIEANSEKDEEEEEIPSEEETIEAAEEEEVAPTEEEVEIDEMDEETFDKLGESYLKKVYDNIDSYRTTSGKIMGNTLMLEGLLTFKSGKKVKTNFIFESSHKTKKGKLKFLGENKQITNNKKAFTLTGSVKDKKLILESLTYNYKGKDAKTRKSVSLYGTVK